MDYGYLKKNRYDWIHDPRKLRDEFANDAEYVPSGRCYCCGRLFQNCKYGIAFCKQCDKAMTMAKEGPVADYSSFWQSREKLKIRDQRIPIDFDDEETIGSEPEFVNAYEMYKLDK